MNRRAMTQAFHPFAAGLQSDSPAPCLLSLGVTASEGPQGTALDSSSPTHLQQFVYIWRTAWSSFLRRQSVSSRVITGRPRRRWLQHRTSCKRRSSVVRALTASQWAVWRLGRCFACELTLTAICTAPFTSGISARSRVEARRTSLENSNWLLARRHMPAW
jgi:hypothetical protein